MNLKSLKKFSQNVHQNCLLLDIILENNIDFDIIFIQEPPWSAIWFISSSTSKEDETIIRASSHFT